MLALGVGGQDWEYPLLHSPPILYWDPCPSLPGHGGVQGHRVLVTPPPQVEGGPGWNVPAWMRECHRAGRASHLPLSPSIPTPACGDNPDVPHMPGPCPPVPGASSMVTCVPEWVTGEPPCAGGTGCTSVLVWQVRGCRWQCPQRLFGHQLPLGWAKGTPPGWDSGDTTEVQAAGLLFQAEGVSGSDSSSPCTRSQQRALGSVPTVAMPPPPTGSPKTSWHKEGAERSSTLPASPGYMNVFYSLHFVHQYSEKWHLNLQWIIHRTS